MLSEKDTKQIYQILCHLCVCGSTYVTLLSQHYKTLWRIRRKLQNYPPTPCSSSHLPSPSTVIQFLFDNINKKFYLNNNAEQSTCVQQCLQGIKMQHLGRKAALIIISSRFHTTAVLNIRPCVSAVFQQQLACKYLYTHMFTAFGLSCQQQMCLALCTLIPCISPLLNLLCANSCNSNYVFLNTHSFILTALTKVELFILCSQIKVWFLSMDILAYTNLIYEPNINKIVDLQTLSLELDFFSMKHHFGGRFGKHECGECRLLMSHCCVFLGYFSVTFHCQLELQMCKVAQCLRKSR